MIICMQLGNAGCVTNHYSRTESAKKNGNAGQNFSDILQKTLQSDFFVIQKFCFIFLTA